MTISGRMTYHVQRDSFISFCGRRIGTPGGTIYPGVHTQPVEWFKTHSFQEAIQPVTCGACAKLALK